MTVVLSDTERATLDRAVIEAYDAEYLESPRRQRDHQRAVRAVVDVVLDRVAPMHEATAAQLRTLRGASAAALSVPPDTPASELANRLALRIPHQEKGVS